MTTSSALRARLADLVLLAVLVGLAAVLTAAMVYQYAGGEIPCPLCLLQRVAMFGIAFGLIQHVRHGYEAHNIGISLCWALLLLMVAVRQTMINIVARPGHAYPGSAVFGLHMPVWSVIIAFAILLALAVTLILFGNKPLAAPPPSPALARIGDFVGLYVIALCLINLASAILQCGLGACHTTGYALLQV